MDNYDDHLLFCAQHGIPGDSQVTAAYSDLGLTEAQLDSAVRSLYVEHEEKSRKLKVRRHETTTPLASVTFTTVYTASIDVVWPVWETLKRSLRSKQDGVPVLMLVGPDDLGALTALKAIDVEYKNESGYGGRGLVESYRQVDNECIVTGLSTVWRAVNQLGDDR